MNASHPEVAHMLHGEEQWLEELVSRSEPFRRSLSTHDPDVARHLRGEEEWLEDLLSRSEPLIASPKSRDVAAASSSQDVAQEGASSSTGSAEAMPVSHRLSGLTSKPTQSFKFGACPQHGTALRPHIWGPGSVKAGQAALVCSRFWKRDERDRPGCWFYRKVIAQEASTWPRFNRTQFHSLKNRFLRAGLDD
jgi:hypothetical protein